MNRMMKFQTQYHHKVENAREEIKKQKTIKEEEELKQK